MIKTLKILGIIFLLLWGASTTWELMEREPGETISIFGQLFFSVGLPYFILFLILLWFLKRSGLEKLPQFMTSVDSHMKEIKAAIKPEGNTRNEGETDA